MTNTDTRMIEKLVFSAECAAVHKRAMMRVSQRQEERDQKVREWMPKGIGVDRFNTYVRPAIEPKRLPATLHEYGGKRLSLREWADSLGINHSTFSNRVRRLGSIAAAIEFRPAPRTARGRKADLHTFRGQSLTLRQWADKLGIHYTTLNKRIARHGGDIQAALNPPSKPLGRKGAAITFGGKTQSIAEWARETGIKEGTIRDRLQVSGWPIERALTEPPNPPGRKPATDHTGGSCSISANPLGTGGGRHETDFDSIGEQP